MAQVSAPNGAGPWTQWRRSVHPMAQVRFYPTDLRRKSASHTLLMAQVPPLKKDLLHSSHPLAPLTLQACTIYPTDLHHSLHPPAPESLLSCQAPSPGTEQRRRTQPSAAATISRNRPLAEHGSGGWRAPSFRKQASSTVPYSPSAGYCHTEGEARVHLLPV